MTRTRVTEEQIIGVLREAQTPIPGFTIWERRNPFHHMDRRRGPIPACEYAGRSIVERHGPVSLEPDSVGQHRGSEVVEPARVERPIG